MILLLGGTSETAVIAEKLARAGFGVLVSTATDVALHVGSHASIEHRRGPLAKEDLKTLIRNRGITAIVNATHPYASNIRETAPEVAQEGGVPYLSYLRPVAGEKGKDVVCANDHCAGAKLAFELRRPVLLTIGSRNILPYGLEAQKTGVPLVARVLDHPASLLACREAGLKEDQIIKGRGPFSIEANRALIRRFEIGVLVTKDSGEAGGVPEKLEAARLEQCRVLLIERPSPPPGAISNMDELLNQLRIRLFPSPGLPSAG